MEDLRRSRPQKAEDASRLDQWKLIDVHDEFVHLDLLVSNSESVLNDLAPRTPF